jgi:hypothetical protein
VLLTPPAALLLIIPSIGDAHDAQHEQHMSSTRSSTMSGTAPITPVITASGCLGHVRMTAKGYQAFDVNDKSIGTFAEPMAAVTAVLTAQST